MKKLVFIATYTTAAILAGCATPYKQGGLMGGFSEAQLAPNVWRVAFQGNGYTGDERARNMALLRSADLTLLNGYTHFALADEKTSSRTAAFSTPGTAHTSFSATRIGNNIQGEASTRFSPGTTMFVQLPTANNTVVMFKGKPDDVPTAFDAQFLCNSLGKQYDTTCEANLKSAVPSVESLTVAPAAHASPAVLPTTSAASRQTNSDQADAGSTLTGARYREEVACVPLGTVAGRTVTLKEWGQVLVKEVWSSNPHCNWGSLAGTATATILVAAPPDARGLSAPDSRAPAVARSIEERLRELKRLREQDLITQEQYDAKQRAILADQ